METNDLQHPNWRALATIHLPLKRFVREGTTDKETGCRNERGRKYQITNIKGQEIKEFYESITQEKPTSSKNTKAKSKKHHDAKDRGASVKSMPKKPFDASLFFRYAMQNNANALEEFDYAVGDINSRDVFGWTALMMAACEGSVDSVQQLLELGATLELVDKSGKNALDLAKLKGHWSLVELLENHQTKEITEMVQLSEATTPPLNPFFCKLCECAFKETNYKQHLTSTLHQFNERSTNAPNKLQRFNIPPKNRGLQLMVKQGWDKESGLGPSNSGRLYPLKTVLRKQRTGLGIEQAPARVTHYEAFDLRATKSSYDAYYKKKQRNSNDMRRERQREWKRDRRLRNELS